MIIGLIPAAGLGTRFVWTFPKEMFPLDYEKRNGKMLPKPMSRYIFDSMILAGAQNIYFVVNCSKLSILKYYGNGSRFNVNIGYLVQENPTGLTRSIEELEGFCSKNDIILFGMPDTWVKPKEVFIILKEKLYKENAHICLGLFYSHSPELFGTVILDEENEFYKCEDKPLFPKTNWIWGTMVLKKSYIDVSKSILGEEVQVSETLNRAKELGLKIAVHKFCKGEYFDFGIYENVLGFLKKAEEQNPHT